MSAARVLVAGVGNIFLADDAFGVELAQRLTRRPLPDGVQVVDFGIRGFDLAYALLDDYDATILLDAVQRGGEPGTVYLIEPDLDGANDPDTAGVQTHDVHPAEVLALVRRMGGDPKRVFLVACEPATFGPDEGEMGLSAPVQAALEPAARLVESLLEDLLGAAVGSIGSAEVRG